MIRRRAPKACISCRARKIKCDVATTGIPCGSCARAKNECSVHQARKRKGYAQGDDALSSPTGTHVLVQAHYPRQYGENGGTEAPHTQEAGFIPSASVPADLELTRHLSLLPADLRANYRDQVEIPSGATNETTATTTSVSRSTELIPPSPTTFDPQRQFPAFIKPFRSTLDPESLAFLELKQALSLPRATVQRELMRSYIHYLHPFLPLLDLQNILPQLNGTSGRNQISFVLYQAIMFAAASFVDMEFLQMEGFSSRLNARKCLFQRVRLLVDFDVEGDQLTLIEVLVLMTYWYDKPDDPKGRMYWMKIALSFAYEIGLNHDSELTEMDAKLQRSRRRLWWCCFTRDKLISASERRPSSIRAEDHRVAVLTPRDFEPQIFSQALREYPAPGVISRPEILVELSIEHMKLCTLLGRVLDTQYAPKGHRRTATGKTVMMLFPESSSTSLSECMIRDRELSEWGETICSRLAGAVDPEPERNCRLVSLHSAMLDMLYHTVLSMLHRPLVALRHPRRSAAQALQEASRQKVKNGARRITEITKYLADSDLLKHVPPIAVTALLTAAIHHTKHTILKDTECPDTSIENLERTMQALFHLREMYCSADHAISFLETLREREISNKAKGGETDLTRLDTQYRQMDYSNKRSQTGIIDTSARVASERQATMDSSSTLSLQAPLVENGVITNREELGTAATATLDLDTAVFSDSLSEIMLSETFDALDFESMDWANVFQDSDLMRSW